jgi:N-acyl-D-aspartate/D-glutamate deacylase
VIIGASDGGAHLDMLSTFDYPVRFLALQRDAGVLSLAETVRQLTDVPARLYGVKDRGRLIAGHWADIVIFDADTVGTGAVEWRDDLPAGAGRLYAEPKGITHVVVNGTDIVNDGQVTGQSPGRVLRSGRDTERNGMVA